eukprot:2398458-Amphidinium_carterae.1
MELACFVQSFRGAIENEVRNERVRICHKLEQLTQNKVLKLKGEVVALFEKQWRDDLESFIEERS